MRNLFDYYADHSVLMKQRETYNFNCGGFALNLLHWYSPTRTAFYEYQDEENLDGACEHFVDGMIDELPNYVRRIASIRALATDEYAIAIRIAPDDFHFCKRLSNGKWLHKMGGGCIEPILKKEVFADTWNNGWSEYTSKLILCAVKKSL